jgi:hypothetical protein
MIAPILSLAAIASSVTAAVTNGDFNVLAFNVAGLPAILNDNAVPGDKATNAGTIGTLFTEYDYDVIHVQEDFAYHAVSTSYLQQTLLILFGSIFMPRMTTSTGRQHRAQLL